MLYLKKSAEKPSSFSENRLSYKEVTNYALPCPALHSSAAVLSEQRANLERGSKRIDADRQLIRQGIKGWPTGSSERRPTSDSIVCVKPVAVTPEVKKEEKVIDFEIEPEKMTLAELIVYMHHHEQFAEAMRQEMDDVAESIAENLKWPWTQAGKERRALEAAKKHMQKVLVRRTNKALKDLQQALNNQRALSKARLEAYQDELTGTLSRRAILGALERSLRTAMRNQSTLSVIMFDIDNFKQINDRTNGKHQTGDEALKKVCARVQRTLRNSDTLGRLGGEEFLIVLEDSHPQQLATVCERLRENITGTDKAVEAGKLQIIDDADQNGKEFHFPLEKGKGIRISISQGAIFIDCSKINFRDFGTEQQDQLIKDLTDEIIASTDDGMSAQKNRGRNNYKIREIKLGQGGRPEAQTVPPGSESSAPPMALLTEEPDSRSGNR